MRNLSKVLIVCVASLCTVAIANTGDVDLRANLTGVGEGKAEWKVSDSGTRLRAELEVDGENLAADSTFTVTVGSNAPFTVTTDAVGEFKSDMRFNTATRPVVNVGDSVTVADDTSTVVLSGVLQNH